MSKELTLKERVAQLEVKIDELKKCFTNHLAHHWAVEILLATAIFGWAISKFLK